MGGPDWQSIRPGRQPDACAGAPKHLARGRLSLGGLFSSGYPELTFSYIGAIIKAWSRRASRASFVNSPSRARVGVRHGAACLLEGLSQAVSRLMSHCSVSGHVRTREDQFHQLNKRPAIASSTVRSMRKAATRSIPQISSRAMKLARATISNLIPRSSKPSRSRASARSTSTSSCPRTRSTNCT